MKKEYLLFKGGELEKIYSKFPTIEKETINNFRTYCSIGGITKRKLDDMQRSIIQFRYITERNFEKLTLEDLRAYLTLLNTSNRKKYTTNGVKIHIKRFLKWKFKDWSERFDNLGDIKLVSGFNEERINEGVLLKKDEIEKIVNKERDITKKAFFITLYESGLRPIELRLLKWDDIRFNVDGDLSELHIFATKTQKARTVFIKDATFYLKKLLDYKISDYVFHSRENKEAPITKGTAINWVKNMGAKINKNIFPYLLRHTRATELYLNMPSKVAQKFMGHKKDMSDLYTHLSSQDVREATLKTVYKFEELTPEKKSELEKEIEKLKQNQDVILKNYSELIDYINKDREETGITLAKKKRIQNIIAEFPDPSIHIPKIFNIE